MNLPVYKMIVSDDMDSDMQIDFVSLVPNPAIEKNFEAFKEHIRFAADEERHIISGPLMLADKPIYRTSPEMGEYYVIFDAENIMKACQKFFKKGYQSKVNLFHDDSQQPDGVTMFESFICDKTRGIMPMKGFEDAADGSWFGSFKVDNEQIWQGIKSGEFKGFSIEGMFGIEPMQQEDPAVILAKIRDIINQTS